MSLFMSDIVDNYLSRNKNLMKHLQSEYGEKAKPFLTGLSHAGRTTLARDIRSSKTVGDVKSALSRARFSSEEIRA